MGVRVITETQIYDALKNVQEPELGRDIVSLNMVKDVEINGSSVSLKIELTTPACPLKDEIERNIHSVLGDLGASEVTVTWGAMVRRAQPVQAQQLLPGVKNIIAVASGKGGVGKIDRVGQPCRGAGHGGRERGLARCGHHGSQHPPDAGRGGRAGRVA